jgi:hypothetical protein
MKENKVIVGVTCYVDISCDKKIIVENQSRLSIHCYAM